MSEIRVFENPKFGKIRTLMIDGEPMFAGVDVAHALGYVFPQYSVSEICKHTVERVVDFSEISYFNPSVKFINESDLYRLILRSRSHSAEKFYDWIADMVIPSIRKNDGNLTNEQIVADALIVANNIIAEKNQKIASMEPKAECFDNQVKFLKTIRNMAKQISQLAEEISETVNK